MIGEPVVTASFGKCSKCRVWVVLQASLTTRTGLGTYEFICPAGGCGATTRITGDQTKLFQVPRSWFERCYFYERKLQEISDVWKPLSV